MTLIAVDGENTDCMSIVVVPGIAAKKQLK